MRRWWPWLFLPVTALAIGMEIYSGVFDGPGTTPWTGYIVHYIPEWVTMALIGVLIIWLPRHFRSHYASSHKGDKVTEPTTPASDSASARADAPTPALAGLTVPADLRDEVLQLVANPRTAEGEPLVLRALLISLVYGILAAVGVNLTPAWRDGVLALVGVFAPVLLAVWSRRVAWSPASVARLLKVFR